MRDIDGVQLNLEMLPQHLGHLKFVGAVLDEDLRGIMDKDVAYNGSWKQRGGVGAFMMLARKWDRLEPLCSQDGYDVFETIRRSGGVTAGDGSAIDQIRDLRRYLTLVEAEMLRELSEAEGGGQGAAADQKSVSITISSDENGDIRSSVERAGNRAITRAIAMGKVPMKHDSKAPLEIDPSEFSPESGVDLSGLRGEETYTHGYDPLLESGVRREDGSLKPTLTAAEMDEHGDSHIDWGSRRGASLRDLYRQEGKTHWTICSGLEEYTRRPD